MAKAEGQEVVGARLDASDMRRDAPNRNRVIVENPRVGRLSELGTYLYGQIADIYFSCWKNEGLCADLYEAELKVNSFDPEEAFIIVDNDTNLVLAMINTLLVRVAGIEDLFRQFPTYKSVETASADRLKTVTPNYRICFSVVAPPGFHVRTATGTAFLSEHLIRNLPYHKAVHQIAYSRYSKITPGAKLAEFYFANLTNPRALGPVGLHEHLGGLAIAFLEESRPEDTNGGGGNILVLYPNSELESQRFAQIKKSRLASKPRLKQIGNLTVLLDL